MLIPTNYTFYADVVFFTVIAIVIWRSVFQTFNKEMTKRKKKQDGALFSASIRTVRIIDDLRSLSKILPFSDMLHAVLLGRKLKALAYLSSKKPLVYKSIWEDSRLAYQEHRGSVADTAPPLTLFKSDEGIEKMLAGSSKLLNFLKSELKRNPSHPEWVSAEFKRMTEIAVTLKVHQLLAYSKKAANLGKQGTAKQSLKEAKEILLKFPSNLELNGLREDVNYSLLKYNIPIVEPPPHQLFVSEDGLERMFGEKRGW